MGQVIEFNERVPKHLAIRMSKMLEGREYGVIVETLGLLVGATCYSASKSMVQEKAREFRGDLLATIDYHSDIQDPP